MNSRFATALRLILPLPSRCAIVDLLGDIVDLFGDDFLGEDFAELVGPVPISKTCFSKRNGSMEHVRPFAP